MAKPSAGRLPDHLRRTLFHSTSGCQWSNGRGEGPARRLLGGPATTGWLSGTSSGQRKGGGGKHQTSVGKMQPQPAADAEGSGVQEDYTSRSGQGRGGRVWDRRAGGWSSEDWHGELRHFLTLPALLVGPVKMKTFHACRRAEQEAWICIYSGLSMVLQGASMNVWPCTHTYSASVVSDLKEKYSVSFKPHIQLVVKALKLRLDIIFKK